MKSLGIALALSTGCSYFLTEKPTATGMTSSSCTHTLGPPIADTTGAVLAWGFVASMVGTMIYMTATYEPAGNGMEGDSRTYEPFMYLSGGAAVLGTAIAIPYTLGARTGFARVEQCRRNLYRGFEYR